MNKKYSDEQREKAVEMVVRRRCQNPRDRTIFREIADACGVGEQSLRIWVRNEDERKRISGLSDEAPVASSSDELFHELQLLRRKIEKLQAENEVLKKAFVVFSSDWAD